MANAAGNAPSDVLVVDYGAGNLRSVVRAIEHVGFPARVAETPVGLADAAVVVLPGVGAAADTMRNLTQRGFVEPLKAYLAAGRPFLGVCMGLQALMTLSEEGGEHPCLDILRGRVVRLPEGQKVPHMGWNAVTPRHQSALLEGIPAGSHFYFVHSYHCRLDDSAAVLATTQYGTDVTAIVERDNVVATQFHPEKSGANGLRFYRNFLSRAFSTSKKV